MQIHFIAIGGAAMHNMAIALKRKGYNITGSDDEIFDPSKSRLEKEGLLPSSIGWDTDNIHDSLDAVILGMHAREDNPELLKAKELGIPIYSYPEYVYEQTKDQTRVVIGGSHGKTTITSMILHVLQRSNLKYDYLVGAQLEGYDCMVKLSEDSKIAIIEGDEYLSSPIDRRPKFHLYQPNIAVISGIAWDHMNVFPTFGNYVEQFKIFSERIEDGGTLVYFSKDENVAKIGSEVSSRIKSIPYDTHPHIIENGITSLIHESGKTELNIFGKHNLQNLNAARNVCNELGIGDAQFYESIASFGGASKRLELIDKTEDRVVYKDFAHSPSKIKATTEALQQQFPNDKMLAVIELHTYSSLNKAFLHQYQGTLESADKAVVYFSPNVLAHKKLPAITKEEVLSAFQSNNVEVFTETEEMKNLILNSRESFKHLLLMSSGHFGGWDLKALAKEWLGTT
ncbi:MAG: peptidoglycan synthetase [Flavobacteriales bacterium]|nr:peptidoglycan synthetase [Flavobacteriales bacterium]